MPGRTVLIVEDEVLIAMSLEDDVRHMGLVPLSTPHLDEALLLAEDKNLVAAVLDVKLRDLTSEGVAALLRQRGIPFVVSTGSGTSLQGTSFDGAPMLTKPYPGRELRALLAQFVPTAEPIET